MYEDNKSFPHKKLSQKFYEALRCAILYHDEVPLRVQIMMRDMGFDS